MASSSPGLHPRPCCDVLVTVSRPRTPTSPTSQLCFPSAPKVASMNVDFVDTWWEAPANESFLAVIQNLLHRVSRRGSRAHPIFRTPHICFWLRQQRTWTDQWLSSLQWCRRLCLNDWSHLNFAIGETPFSTALLVRKTFILPFKHAVQRLSPEMMSRRWSSTVTGGLPIRSFFT
ncbi:hypothetical protein BDZ89DRAFT_448719 [Hymenopellis radicata]|nr:hypothetical protein BDZ89DRAFT_448719 [Hymenopellis radicata]